MFFTILALHLEPRVGVESFDNHNKYKARFLARGKTNGSAENRSIVYAAGQFKAFSSGSRPSGTINPKAVAVMAELGYDLSTHRNTSLNEVRDMAFDYVVTMGCGDACPFIAAHQRHD